MEDKLGKKIMTKFVGLRANGSEDKKAEGAKEWVIKKIKSENYKNCFEATQLDNKIKNLEKK